MSHFAKALTACLQDGKQQDLADRTNLGKSTISRILAGDLPRRSTLPAIITGVTSDRKKQAKLLAAYLKDVIDFPETPSDLIHISVDPPQESIQKEVSEKTYKQLHTVAKAIAAGHSEFADLLETMAQLADRMRSDPTEHLRVAEDPAPFENRPRARLRRKSDHKDNPASA